MQRTNRFKMLSLLLMSMIGFCLSPVKAEDLPADEAVEVAESGELVKKGYLSVPSAVGASCDTLTVELLTPAVLGNTTTNLCRCKLYKMIKSSYYSPAAVNGCPMFKISASGATLDLCHTCLSFCRTDCTTHCVGIEVGYSPCERENDPSLMQPSSVTIQNGIMNNWDMAIVVHSGVRNVVIKDMIFTNNVIPIVVLGENNEKGTLINPVCSVTLENVSIIGACSAQRLCLDWIRAFIANGILSDSSATLEKSYGYVNGETMPCWCNPVCNEWDDLFVYSGIYTYGASDIRLKNVHVTANGFDGNLVDAPQEGEDAPVPAMLAERTATFGMWFRKTQSIFMQDVASVKNKSSMAVAGVMFDESELISVKNGQFSSNTITQQQPAYVRTFDCPDDDLLAICKEGLWAAGVVLKDSHTANFCDVVVSENQGVDTAWGVRTILSAVFDNTLVSSTVTDEAINPNAITSPAGRVGPTIDIYSPTVHTLTFENVYADSLRADRVYAYDFGDLTRKIVTRILNNTDNTQEGPVFEHFECLPAGAVHKLNMKNVSACSAKGKVVNGNAEAEVAKEFKGIYLGDDSKGVVIDGARIGATQVVFDDMCASYIGSNSGIEFGSRSTMYVLERGDEVDDDLVDFEAKAAAATGQAQGAISDLHMNNLNIANNMGGSHDFRFVGIRAVSTGTNECYNAGQNKFSNIKLTNSMINANQFDGFRAVDDVKGHVPTPVMISGLYVDNVSFNDSTDGYGFNIDNIVSSVFKNVNFDLNNVRGFTAKDLSCVDFYNVSASDTRDLPQNLCGKVITEVYGFDVSEQAKSLRIENGRFNSTNATDADVAGFHIYNGKSIELKDVQSDCNKSVMDAGNGPFTTRGFYFENMVDNLSLKDVNANSNCALNGNVYGIEIDRATSVHADHVKANNNTAEGVQSTNCNVSTAIGMFFKATVGSKTSEGCLLKDLQACGNTNAHRAYGIYMQEPIGLDIQGIDGSSNVSNVVRPLLADGSANPFLAPILSQAVGIYFEGGAAVHMSDVHASANNQKEVTPEYLSRHLLKGFSVADSEAVKNISDQIAHHFPVANRSGAYGVLADGTQDVSIHRGSASNNSGVRAFGVHARHADNFCIHEFDALENYGVGTPFFNENPFNLLSPDAQDLVVRDPGADGVNPEVDPQEVDVPDMQAACLYGWIDPATKLDMKKTYSDLLVLIKKHEANVRSGDDCDRDPCDRVNNTDACIPAHFNLLWAMLAPCRRFSTGAGIGMYASSYAMIKKCRAMGNYSLHDSGGGFVFYGKGEGHTIVESIAANNECYKLSERGGLDSFNINGNIDISSWHPFYNFLDVGMLKSETVNSGAANDTYGFEVLPHIVIKSDHIDEDMPIPTPLPQRQPTPNALGQLIQPEGTTTNNYQLNLRKLAVAVLPTFTTVQEDSNEIPAEFRIDLCNFVGVGPIGVGILLECQRDCNVADNSVFGNKGHSSLGFGILSDAASACMFIDNKATNNSADALGYAWGLADFAMSSPNVWYKNWMYANRVDTFMNSSYLIVFDNALSAGQTLPVREIFPGSIEILVNSLPLDNIVVRFLNDRQEFDCVGNLVTDKWASSDLLVCGL